MKVFSICLLLLLVVCVCAKKKVVVVMVENRSFDHIFGSFEGVDGSKGKNFTNPLFDGKTVGMDENVPYVVPCDPCHSLPCTTSKIFGVKEAKSGNLTNATMSGFAETEYLRGNEKQNNYCDVLSSYPSNKLPVLNFLAKEFALFDKYYCSLPGPTWPNRMYAVSATSAGSTETFPFFQNKPGQLFPQQTIFAQLLKQGFSTKYYYQTTPWELFMKDVFHNPEILHTFDQFLSDCKSGTLPDYSWINPRSGCDFENKVGSNDAHPDHDIALTEAFLKEIYDNLRASPDWNNTVLMITFDEHGGYFDHVVPPSAPPPDNIPSYPDKGFKFDRLGVRVPLIVVSPLIPRNTIIHDPSTIQKPYPSSQFEHSSLLSTARRLLGAKGFLTKRDEWSANFDDIVSLTEARDCPKKAPNPPASSLNIEDEANFPINDLQKDLLKFHGIHKTKGLKQLHLHKLLTNRFQSMKKGLKKMEDDLSLQIGPMKMMTAPIKEKYFLYDFDTSKTIYSRSLNVSGTHFCVTNSEGSLVPTLCKAFSIDQKWLWLNDGTIRPENDSTQCWTVLASSNLNPDSFGVHSLKVTPCTNDLNQHFTYYGSYFAGSDANGPGELGWGDGTSQLVIVEKTK